MSTRPGKRITLDLISDYIRGTKKEVIVYAPAFNFDKRFYSRVEKIYLDSLKPNLIYTRNTEQLLGALKRPSTTFVIIPRSLLKLVKSEFKSQEFVVLKPIHERSEKAFVLSGIQTGLSLFRKSKD